MTKKILHHWLCRGLIFLMGLGYHLKYDYKPRQSELQ
jgi:hypothetical protein